MNRARCRRGPGPAPWPRRGAPQEWESRAGDRPSGSAARSTSTRSGQGATSGIRPVSSTACATLPSRVTSRPSEVRSTRKSGSDASRHSVWVAKSEPRPIGAASVPDTSQLAREHRLEIGQQAAPRGSPSGQTRRHSAARRWPRSPRSSGRPRRSCLTRRARGVDRRRHRNGRRGPGPRRGRAAPSCPPPPSTRDDASAVNVSATSRIAAPAGHLEAPARRGVDWHTETRQRIV